MFPLMELSCSCGHLDYLYLNQNIKKRIIDLKWMDDGCMIDRYNDRMIDIYLET